MSFTHSAKLKEGLFCDRILKEILLKEKFITLISFNFKLKC